VALKAKLPEPGDPLVVWASLLAGELGACGINPGRLGLRQKPFGNLGEAG
jgi:hypothetical protein